MATTMDDLQVISFTDEDRNKAFALWLVAEGKMTESGLEALRMTVTRGDETPVS